MRLFHHFHVASHHQQTTVPHRWGLRHIRLAAREFFEKEREEAKGGELDAFALAKKYRIHVEAEKAKESINEKKSNPISSFINRFEPQQLELTPPPIPLTRKAQLEKLQLSLANPFQKKAETKRVESQIHNSVESARLVKAGEKVRADGIPLLDYHFSYFPVELRYQDMDRYIEQENTKRAVAYEEEQRNEKEQKRKTMEKSKRQKTSLVEVNHENRVERLNVFRSLSRS